MLRMTRIETAAEAQAFYAAAGNSDFYVDPVQQSGARATPSPQKRRVAVDRDVILARARVIRSPWARE
jgi:hypothetical protein